MRQAATQFLNVDLELHSRRRTAALIEALVAEGMVLLHRRSGFAALEFLPQAKDVDRGIARIAKAVLALRKSVRREWDQCRKRVFNVGIEAGREPSAAEFEIRRETLEALAGIDATIVFTVYVPQRRRAGRRPSRRRASSRRRVT